MANNETLLSAEIQSLYSEYAKLSAMAAAEIQNHPAPFYGCCSERLRAIERKISTVRQTINELGSRPSPA
jgi:hypothetical protein